VAPLWCATFLPFADMPNQVALIAMVRHWLDPSWALQDRYQLALGDSQYVLYHLVGALLSLPLGSAETANRVLLTGIGLGLPYSLRALLRALGRDERLALLATPLFWSAPLLMGFAPYLASAPVVTWGMATVIRHARAPTPRRWLGLAALACGLFYLHVSGYVLFVASGIGLTIVLVAGQPGASWREALALAPGRLGWIAPSAALSLAWAARGSLANRAIPVSERAQIDYLPAAKLAAQLPIWAHDVWQSHVDEGCAIALWVAIAMLAAQGERSPRADADRALARAAWVPLACSAACYVALPHSIGFGAMINTRVALFVVLYVPLVLRPIRPALPLAIAFASTLVTAGYAAHEVRAAERDELGDIGRLIDRIPPRGRVLTLPFHMTSAYTHWPPWQFMGSYHLARTGGTASMSFIELPHWPVHYRPERAPPAKPVAFWNLVPCLYRNTVDGEYFDYLLVRGPIDPSAHAPAGPRWTPVDREREWTLYEKTDDEVPDTGAERDDGPCVPPPRPPHEAESTGPPEVP
jgi:hypothetical protein